MINSRIGSTVVITLFVCYVAHHNSEIDTFVVKSVENQHKVPVDDHGLLHNSAKFVFLHTICLNQKVISFSIFRDFGICSVDGNDGDRIGVSFGSSHNCLRTSLNDVTLHTHGTWRDSFCHAISIVGHERNAFQIKRLCRCFEIFKETAVRESF